MMTLEASTTYKAYNTVTGKWFVDGKGFVAECKHDGTKLDSAGVVVVRYCYLNVGVDTIKGAYGCGCDSCEG